MLIGGLLTGFGLFKLLAPSFAGADKPFYKKKKLYIIGAIWLLFAYTKLTTPPPPAITSLTLDSAQSIEMDINETTSLPVLVLEEGASTDDVEFTSSDPDVVSFEADRSGEQLVGVLQSQSEGSAEIRVMAGDLSSQVIAVTVIDRERIAAEEEAARIAAEEEAARIAAEEEAARLAAEQAAAEQAAQQAAAQQEEPKEEMVWIPKTGSKYHSYSTCSGMEGASQVPISKAKSMGFTACKRCH